LRGKRVEIQTRDGVADAHVFTPENGTSGPGVLFYMDGISCIDLDRAMSDTSSFLLAPKMQARVYIGVADKDAGHPPAGPRRRTLCAAAQNVTRRSHGNGASAHASWVCRDRRLACSVL